MIRPFATTSLRGRLALASALIAAVLLSALAAVVIAQVRGAAASTATQLAVADLQSYAVDLSAQPQEGPDLPATGLLVLVVDPDGRVRRSSMPTELAEDARSVTGTAAVELPSGRFEVVHRDVVTSTGTWSLWAARDLTASDALLQGVVMTLAVGTPLAVLVTALAAWLVAAAALRPVERMRTTADRLRAPGGTGTLPSSGGRELVGLAATLNALITDLRTSLAYERRVTADAAHELRTPLAVLAAEVELARRDPDRIDPQAIAASVDRLTRLVDDLLALSRAEASDADGLAPSRLGDLITETMSAVDAARTLSPEGVLVDLEVPARPSEDALVPIDALGFGRIVTNLLANALQAAPTSVVVRLTEQEGSLLVAVCDDGSGVPEDFLPFVFDRFARPADARSSGAGGSGLGLALVKRLAERSGGTATLRNTPPGATATIRLPLRP